MCRLIKFFVTFTFCLTLRAAEQGPVLDWDALSKLPYLLAPLDKNAASPSITVVSTNKAELNLPLLALDKPPITETLYAIEGEVRYENVEGTGYLELWNFFGESSGSKYFSRTLAENGPLGKIAGSSEWRPFSLPFNSVGAHSSPKRIEFNLHLEGPGKVEIRNVRLLQGAAAGKAVGVVPSHHTWWPVRAGGWIGGIFGAVVGILGTMMERKASKGQSREFVIGTSLAICGVGGIALLVGLIAMGLGQPFAIWYVLILIGILSLAIFPVRIKRYRKIYGDQELRKMQAIDAA